MKNNIFNIGDKVYVYDRIIGSGEVEEIIFNGEYFQYDIGMSRVWHEDEVFLTPKEAIEHEINELKKEYEEEFEQRKKILLNVLKEYNERNKT